MSFHNPDDDALAAQVPALWFELGCVDEVAAARALAGVRVVMDRCIAVEHSALLGGSWRVSRGDTPGGR